MPGTIQVSVLNFKGLSSPPLPSSLFIKVSMGKRDYQTWDKGDFSFPLTTLRDILIVTLQDDEGNEISHIGVQSMSIVEKGIWDDLFPLEGGGHVHMKLQFILNEDERNRILGVRESALKKKQGEVLNYNLRHSKETSRVGDSVASSAPINHEDDSSMLGGSRPVFAVKNRPVLFNLEDNPVNKQEKQGPLRKPPSSVRKMISAFETSLVQERRPPIVQVAAKSQSNRAGKEGPLKDQDSRHITKEAESISGRLRNPTVMNSGMLENPADSSSGRLENPVESSSRRLVNPAESSLIRPGDSVESSTVGLKNQAKLNPGRLTNPTESSLGKLMNPADSSSGRLINPAQLSSERLRNRFFTEKSQKFPPDSMITGEHISIDKEFGGIEPSLATRQLMESSTSQVRPEKAGATIKSVIMSDHKEMKKEGQKSPDSLTKSFTEPGEHKVSPMKTGEHVGFDKDFGDNKPSQATRQVRKSNASKVQLKEADASIKSEPKSDHEEMRKEWDNSPEGLIRSSTLKTATVLGQKEEEISSGLQPSHFDAEQKDSGVHSVIEGGGEGTASNNSSDILVASNDKLNSDKQYHYESSGVWIFPDDTRHLCITTSVSEVVKLHDGCHAEGKKSYSIPENLEKHELQCGLDAQMMKSENNSQKLRRSKPESSADDAFTGAVKQAIKIAIVLGFGTLVLFTRQREPRKSSRKAHDPFFTKLHYIDLQTSMEE